MADTLERARALMQQLRDAAEELGGLYGPLYHEMRALQMKPRHGATDGFPCWGVTGEPLDGIHARGDCDPCDRRNDSENGPWLGAAPGSRVSAAEPLPEPVEDSRVGVGGALPEDAAALAALVRAALRSLEDSASGVSEDDVLGDGLAALAGLVAVLGEHQRRADAYRDSEFAARGRAFAAEVKLRRREAELGVLRLRAEHAEAARDQAHACLKRIEWIWDEGAEQDFCVDCGRSTAQGHDRSCNLAAALVAVSQGVPGAPQSDADEPEAEA